MNTNQLEISIANAIEVAIKEEAWKTADALAEVIFELPNKDQIPLFVEMPADDGSDNWESVQMDNAVTIEFFGFWAYADDSNGFSLLTEQPNGITTWKV